MHKSRLAGFIIDRWVMEAPTGQRFCVVRPQSSRFAAEANAWE